MGTDYYFIVTYQEGNPVFDEREDLINQKVRQEFKDFFHIFQIIQSILEPSSVCIMGYMKNYEQQELLDLIGSLPWLWPETLQVLVKSEHDDKYEFVEFDEPERYRYDKADIVFRDGKWHDAKHGQSRLRS